VRFAIASAVLVIGCTARPPAPMPPPRTYPAPPETLTAKPVARDLPKPVEEPTERHRYTEWVVLADVMTIPLAATWFFKGEISKSILWGVPVVLATPTVHLLEGNTKMAAISVSTRAAAYGLAYYAIQRIKEPTQPRNVPWGWIFLTEVAIILPTTLDLVFAYIDRPVPGWTKLPIIPAVMPTVSEGNGVNGATLALSLTL
jgi:hypothetical protein